MTYYYCSNTITNYICPYGYLFDSTAKTCSLITNKNLFNCFKGSSSSNTMCENGTGFYLYLGCQNFYYCDQQIFNFLAPNGYLFDQNYLLLRPFFTFKCPF